MNFRLLAALILAAAVLSGCDTLEDASRSVREKFEPKQSVKTRTFSSPQRVVYDAVKVAADSMGYRQSRGGAAQGEFEGIGGVGEGETAHSARQVGIHVHLQQSLDGNETTVSVRFTEILESNASSQMGMATETTMKDTPLYESFFRHVQQALAVRPSAQPVEK
jgi:outer membrane lipoprotein SlyB